jgi:hypothetical protein
MPNQGAMTIAQALKAASFGPSEIANALIAPDVYPSLTAREVAQILLTPALFPQLLQNEMQAALTAAPFAVAAITEALAALYQQPVSPWLQAPLLTFISAANRGRTGEQLFGIDPSGRIWTTARAGLAGAWTPWDGPGFASQTFTAVQIAVGGQNTGVLYLWALDDAGNLHEIAQNQAGGWDGWTGPKARVPSARLTYIAAAEQNGNRGVELFAVDIQGQIWTVYQQTPGGAWSIWEGSGFKHQPAPVAKAFPVQQNNGRLFLFTIDAEGKVRGISQQSPGGEWGPWSDGPAKPVLQLPPLVAQAPFVEITGAPMGGNRGAMLWALSADGQIWSIYQTSAGGPWSAWSEPGFANQPVPMRKIAAVQQRSKACQLFALDVQHKLWTVTQTAEAGSWNAWQPSQGQRLPPLTG